MNETQPCNCPICIRNKQFLYFKSRLPEVDQVAFDRWYDRIFCELEELVTDKEMQQWESRERTIDEH